MNWTPTTFSQDKLWLLASSGGTYYNRTVLGGPGSRKWNVLGDSVSFVNIGPGFKRGPR